VEANRKRRFTFKTSFNKNKPKLKGKCLLDTLKEIEIRESTGE